MAERRFHPFLQQWVAYATHRQDRTFHPPADFCPLCPTRDERFATEVPRASYDIAVFENRFPSFSEAAPEVMAGLGTCPRACAEGVCEVVCYSDRHDATLAEMPYRQIRKLTRVWQERTEELGARASVEYVFIFENKGREIGVTLSHPHGQIYGYPFVPPVPARELDAERDYRARTGRSLTGDWLADELATGDRVVWEDERWVALVPYFARYPFETYLLPKDRVPGLVQLAPSGLDSLAAGLLAVTRKFDGLFGFSLPYVMAVHQSPSKSRAEDSWLHVEFYPPHRTADKLKYLAGSEAGAGAFINDTLPEETAARLRAVEVGDVRA